MLLVENHEYPIKVTLDTGTVLTVHSSRDTIEGYYGDVNKLVDQMVKPLHHVKRIAVEVYDEELEEVIQQVTYDQELEEWIAYGERIVVTLDPYGIGMEDEERGYMDKIDGWLPKYALRYQKHAHKKHALLVEDVVLIETAKEVNRRANIQRSLDRYYADPETHNKKRMELYYKNHEENKRKKAEAGRRWRQRQKELVKL